MAISIAAAAAATSSCRLSFFSSSVFMPKSKSQSSLSVPSESPKCPKHLFSFSSLRCSSVVVVRSQISEAEAEAEAEAEVEAPATVLPVFSFSGERVDAHQLRPPAPSSTVASSPTSRTAGGKKPYQQKKTGKARRGSQQTPLRPGGGVIFGPKPKDWSIKINRKEKRLALSTAIASASATGRRGFPWGVCNGPTQDQGLHRGNEEVGPRPQGEIHVPNDRALR